ncbi:MAG: calcium-translocating P-type ATPase, SERCA-type [Christensenellales bacterium]|jgi:Ca2+-transporting ATPase
MSYWYSKNSEQILSELSSSAGGLSPEEAAKRLKDGYNELAQQVQRTLLDKIIAQLKDFMVIVLIAAAAVSFIIGEGVDALIILGIVVINAVLGIVQENKAEKSLDALKELSAPVAHVLRGGVPAAIPSRELVRGDVVLLETGSMVPADLRLIESVNLKIQEASMTGESVPSEKNMAELPDENVPLGDRHNMAFSSTMVTYGRGRGIVVETGMDTEIGKIAGMISSVDSSETPLKKKLGQLGKTLGIAALAICAVIFIIGVMYGKEVADMFLTSVSLAVAAIPEGLPAIATVVLALGVQRMAKRNAIIRTLPAVETLGRATIICSDKTGTLTQNKMTVTSISAPDNVTDVNDATMENFDAVIKCAVLCNDAALTPDGPIGDPTETALITMAEKLGLKKDEADAAYPRLMELPFESERKLMTTVHNIDGNYRSYTKGALDELLKRCTHILKDGEVQPLDEGHKAAILETNSQLANEALRVLGYAYRELDRLPHQDEMPNIESQLIFAGLTGMIDPPRPEAADAVAKCLTAGIKPIMITGDHRDTAVAIARSLGIINDASQVVTGIELDNMNEQQLKEAIGLYSVYARVSPEHKVRIVQAWQTHGAVVAMTGDGVNDAPALKLADIGAAMGITGTDVAKDAADMVLADDNFSTVVAAVEEGRRIFDNILKSIQYLISCNVGEIITLFVATLLNWSEPLLPIHILWVNLVTDSLPALALGVDPASSGIMKIKAADRENDIFSRSMIWRTSYQGVMVGALTLTAFIIGQRHGLEYGRTMAFTVLAFSQLVHVFNVRSGVNSIFKTPLFNNRTLWAAVAISGGLMLAILVVPPLMDLFKVVPLNAGEWITVALLSFSPIVIIELFKLFKLDRLFLKRKNV